MDATSEPERNGFRILLAAGAFITLMGAVGGLFASGVLHTALNLDVERDAPGYAAIARLFGAAMLPLGVGYAIAALHPMRNRGLLVVLFLVPLVGAVVMIAAVARGEIARVNGSVLSVLHLAYVLLYFRLYPKPVRTLVPGLETDDEPPPDRYDEPPTPGSDQSDEPSM